MLLLDGLMSISFLSVKLNVAKLALSACRFYSIFKASHTHSNVW